MAVNLTPKQGNRIQEAIFGARAMPDAYYWPSAGEREAK